MNKRGIVVFIILIMACLLAWVWMMPRPAGKVPKVPHKESSNTAEAPGITKSPSPQPTTTQPPATEPPAAPQPAVQGSPLPPSERRDLGNPLAPASIPEASVPRPAQEDPTAAAELDKVALMIRDYRTIAGENPVGTNAEIMKALMGDNPRGAKLGPPEGMTLNGAGELLDGWGTPIFFHQISADVMEIHSAGPDKRLGTEDDFVLK